MTSHDTFFQEKQPAAVLKHALLREYAQVFASTVGSINRSRPVWVIDGYAGAGAYETLDPEGAHADGSPLVLLKMAENFTTQRINSIFIEADAKAVSALRLNTQPFSEKGLGVTVLQGTVEACLPTACNQVAGDPVVTFLDPFGVALDRHTLINTLLSRPQRAAPSEVLLNINLEAVRRIGGVLENRRGRILPKAGQEKTAERLDNFLGGSAWRSQFHQVRHEHGSAATGAEHVINSYRAGIEAETGYESICIPIRRRPNHEPLFLLTLFFRHPVAGYKFADAACRATRAWRGTYRAQELDDFLGRQEQESLFGDAFERENNAQEGERQEADLDAEWIDAICVNVRNFGARRIEVVTNVRSILGTTLGLAGERHIRKAWDKLVVDGYLHPRNTSTKMHRAIMERT